MSAVASLSTDRTIEKKRVSRILVVEDSAAQAHQIKGILASAEREVEVALDAERGLYLFLTNDFDLVVTDVLLPGMSGYDLCGQIKNHPSKGHVPVILLTSLSDPMNIIRGLECGANNFITKPYRADHLLGRVRTILDRKANKGNNQDRVGTQVVFQGKALTVNSNKEQILDLLIASFEDMVRTNQELQISKAELAAAKRQVDQHARRLENRVRTTEEKRKKLEEQFHQAQKMEAVGKLAGGIAHDFNNLLTVISGYSELLTTVDSVSRKTCLREIHNAVERGVHLTRQLLAFSRKAVVEPRVLDLNALVQGTEMMLTRLIGEDIRLTANLAPGLGQIKADAGQIEQVIVNLVVNARDAMPQGGNLTIETSNVTKAARRMVRDDGKLADSGERAARLTESGERALETEATAVPRPHVLLTVRDTGIGMSEETKAHIFEPFFTTKAPGKGTGLGLATVYGIVAQSGGHIEVDTELNRGTSFKIYFPSSHVDAAPRKSKSDPNIILAPRGHETILLVEDEEDVRNIARLTLESCEYKVLEAPNGNEAIRLCEQYAQPIHLLLTDVVMPEMGGRQVAERMAASRPGIKILFISGYTDDAVVRHGIFKAEVAFLQKPFKPSGLAAKVREVLDQ